MTEKKTYKYVDLSGYANTGKLAVMNLLQEFKGYFVPHAEFEFLLLRIQGGILDLEDALFRDWSPIRSDSAIRRFKKLIKKLGSRNKISDPRTWFTAVGTQYETYFNNMFFKLSEQYISKLIDDLYVIEWPYALADLCGFNLFIRKLANKLGIKHLTKFKVNLSFPENFFTITKDYLNELLSANVPPDTNTIVLQNAFEPFNPDRSLKYFDFAKCIIVDRDPRDNYVAQKKLLPIYIPVEIGVPVRQFINRYRIHRKASKKFNDGNKDVLRIKFEELVMEYENTLDKIFEFLGEDKSIHIHPKRYFDPAISIKNVGIWKNYRKKEEIAMIENELKEYCYNI